MHTRLRLLAAAATTAAAFTGFVRTNPQGQFIDDTGPVRYAGTNVYYGHYSPNFMTDDAFERAAANNFSVVRVWAFFDEARGNVPAFQYYNATARTVMVNTTALARLDYLLMRASALGLRLVLTCTNNWADFGGMDTHGTWRRQQDPTFGTWYHDDFYTDSVVRGWYQQFLRTLITRTNTLTGVPYLQDPTIFAWQLANEPRCVGTGGAPESPRCVTRPPGGAPVSVLTEWAATMSAYIRSLDPNHMISVGDEGFYCAAVPQGSPVNMYDCSSGGDNLGYSKIPDISYGTAHLYPESWGSNVQWGVGWIVNHTQQWHAANKPFVLEEYGLSRNIQTQDADYKLWTDTVLSAGTNGDHHWMIAGLQSPGGQWYGGGALDVICRIHPNDPAVPRGNNANTCAVLHAHALAMIAAK